MEVVTVLKSQEGRCALFFIDAFFRVKRDFVLERSFMSNSILQACHCKIQCVKMHTTLHNCNVQMALFLTLTSRWSPYLYFVYSAGLSELRIHRSAPINLVVLVITCRYFIRGQTTES
jgi:hypothetical protein